LFEVNRREEGEVEKWIEGRGGRKNEDKTGGQRKWKESSYGQLFASLARVDSQLLLLACELLICLIVGIKVVCQISHRQDNSASRQESLKEK